MRAATWTLPENPTTVVEVNGMIFCATSARIQVYRVAG
jgi:hypothetical protein